MRSTSDIGLEVLASDSGAASALATLGALAVGAAAVAAVVHSEWACQGSTLDVYIDGQCVGWVDIGDLDDPEYLDPADSENEPGDDDVPIPVILDSAHITDDQKAQDLYAAAVANPEVPPGISPEKRAKQMKWIAADRAMKQRRAKVRQQTYGSGYGSVPQQDVLNENVERAVGEARMIGGSVEDRAEHAAHLAARGLTGWEAIAMASAARDAVLRRG